MKAYIKQVMNDETGKPGSKRWAGFIVLFVYLVLIIIGTFTTHIPDPSVRYELLGLIVGFWGLNSLDKFNALKNPKP